MMDKSDPVLPKKVVIISAAEWETLTDQELDVRTRGVLEQFLHEVHGSQPDPDEFYRQYIFEVTAVLDPLNGNRVYTGQFVDRMR
jgi:hypothetical protein